MKRPWPVQLWHAVREERNGKMTDDLFERAPVPRAYFKLALPVVFSMVISLVYNMVDTFFIARTQNTSIVAGVSLCAPVFTLMIALGDIFGLGGSSVISRLFGQKKDGEGKKVSGFCFYAAILCGAAVSVSMLLFRTPILHLLGAGKDTWEYASQYYTYMALGAPAVILSLTPGNLMRTEGLAVEAMIGTVVGSVVNIILDPVFIFGLGMGAGGAAIATVLGNLVTDIILVCFVLKKSRKLTLSIHISGVKKQDLLAVFAIGIPASVTNLMQSLGMALMNRYLVQYGTDKVAAMGIAMKVNMIVMLIMVGFAFGAQPLIGYNYGAGRLDRVKEAVKFSVKTCTIILTVCAVVGFAFAPQIVTLFRDDLMVIDIGTRAFRYQCFTLPLGAVLTFANMFFQSLGKSVRATILAVCRQGVFIPLVYLLSWQLGLTGLELTQAVSDLAAFLISGTIMVHYFLREFGKERV